MKNQRISRVVNFFAFNLLFFALYLNFIHQDANILPRTQQAHSLKMQTKSNDHAGQYQKSTSFNTTTEQTMAVNATN